MNTWIYLSPHLDDVALSLGGLLWEQAAAGDETAVWTICAGDMPDEPLSPFAQSLHARWETGPEAMVRRRAEDIVACSILGASHRHFSIPDCIYRQSLLTGDYLYASENSLFGRLHPDEQVLVRELSQTLKEALTPEVNLVCPLGLGNHVDHQLTRAAAEHLQIPLWYYADYPYLQDVPDWQPQQMNSVQFAISEKGIMTWGNAVAAHQSQISTFWEDLSDMRRSIKAYSQQMGGQILWKMKRTNVLK